MLTKSPKLVRTFELLTKRSMSIIPPKYSKEFKKVENYQKFASRVFEFNEVDTDAFRPTTLSSSRQGHQSSAYGGILFAQALAAAEKTINDAKFKPHSMHSYFILSVDTRQEITYHVRRIRDGKSFSTRTVEAIQNGSAAFLLQVSFHVEENDSICHQTRMPKVAPPESLIGMRDAVPYIKEMVENGQITLPPAMLRRIRNYDSNVYSGDQDLFEMRCTNLGNYYGFASDLKPELCFWMRARGDLNDDEMLHRWLVAYNSDSTLLATSINPHFANGFVSSMLFSMDHCVWFHRTDFRADEWILFETKSDVAGNGRTLIEGRIWKRDGTLLATCHQEGLVRTKDSVSRI